MRKQHRAPSSPVRSYLGLCLVAPLFLLLFSLTLYGEYTTKTTLAPATSPPHAPAVDPVTVEFVFVETRLEVACRTLLSVALASANPAIDHDRLSTKAVWIARNGTRFLHKVHNTARFYPYKAIYLERYVRTEEALAREHRPDGEPARKVVVLTDTDVFYAGDLFNEPVPLPQWYINRLDDERQHQAGVSECRLVWGTEGHVWPAFTRINREYQRAGTEKAGGPFTQEEYDAVLRRVSGRADAPHTYVNSGVMLLDLRERGAERERVLDALERYRVLSYSCDEDQCGAHSTFLEQWRRAERIGERTRVCLDYRGLNVHNAAHRCEYTAFEDDEDPLSWIFYRNTSARVRSVHENGSSKFDDTCNDVSDRLRATGIAQAAVALRAHPKLLEHFRVKLVDMTLPVPGEPIAATTRWTTYAEVCPTLTDIVQEEASRGKTLAELYNSDWRNGKYWQDEVTRHRQARNRQKARSN